MMQTVKNYIESADLTSLDYLLSWKESRSNIAPDPITGKSFVSENTVDFISFLVPNLYCINSNLHNDDHEKNTPQN